MFLLGCHLRFWNPANSISLLRLPLLFWVITLILRIPPFHALSWQKVSLFLVAFLILLDQVDGFIARKTDSVTKIGGMIDVMVDRIVELLLWVTFTVIDSTLVPLWVPFLFITRGIITDTLRSEAYRKNLTPYEMIHSTIGKAVVSSHISRGIYALLKGFTFCYIIAVPAFNFQRVIAQILVYCSSAYCIARGLPVIYDARDLFKEDETSERKEKT